MFDRIDAAVYHPIRCAAYFFRRDEYLKYVPGEGVQTLAGSKVRRIGVDGWRSLPNQFRSDIDAAICYSNGYIYFFKGGNYVKYKPGDGVVPTSSGSTIRTIGITGWTSFPSEFRSDIDAALYYPYNGHAYFFKGDAYIKYKPGVGVVEYEGEAIRQIGVTGWKDLPEEFTQEIDAALYYPHTERLYFFKERDYVRWNPGNGVDPRYPRRLGLWHRRHGGWPGLSTLLGGPIIGNLTSDTATIWMWLTGGKTPEDVILKLDGTEVTDPVYTTPDVGTAATDVLEGVEEVDVGSAVQLVRFSELTSNSEHRVDVCRADDGFVIETVSFKTAPPSNEPARIRIGLGSCANSTIEAAVDTFEALARKPLDLLILCGDNCYYYDSDLEGTGVNSSGGDWDSVAKMLTRQLEARNHPQFVPVARSIPVFSTWDDHDFSYNNCDGLKNRDDTRWVRRDCAAGVYRLMWNHPYRVDGNHIYYDFHWGPLHFFMTDGRYHSNRNDCILGDEQLAWLLDDLKASQSPLKIIVFSSQLIPTDSKEGFANAAPTERDQILDTISNDVDGRVLVFSGDVHFSECQRYPEESNTPKIVEVTSSPLRVHDEDKRDTQTANSNRLWHTVENSFAVIDIDLSMKKADGPRSVTIKAYDKDGVVLDSAGPSGKCRTVWNLFTGELS